MQLRALVHLVEDLGSIHSTHKDSQMPIISIPEDLMLFSDLHWDQVHTHGKQTYMKAKHSCNKNKDKKLKRKNVLINV